MLDENILAVQELLLRLRVREAMGGDDCVHAFTMSGDAS